RNQLTSERFIVNHFSQDTNARLYKTGDLVRWLEDGNLEFIGRIDHQVKIHGYRIELNEIKSIIEQYPDVSESVVLLKELPNGEKNLVSYLVENVDKIRIPYAVHCLGTLETQIPITQDKIKNEEIQIFELLTEDISKEGIAVSGIQEKLTLG